MSAIQVRKTDSTVIRNRHEIHHQLQWHFSHRICHEAHHAALHPYQRRLFQGVIPRYAFAKLLDLLVNLSLSQKHAIDALNARLDQRPEAKLRQQPVGILAVKQPYRNLRVKLMHQPDLSVFVGDEALIHRGEFEVQVNVWQVEIRSEHLEYLVVFVIPTKWEGPRLILQAQTIEVKNLGKFLFAGMGEFGLSVLSGNVDRLISR